MENQIYRAFFLKNTMMGGSFIATTWIKPRRPNGGKSVAQTISACVHYAINPNKTDGGRLVSGYGCDARTADTEFIMSKREYVEKQGRNQGKKDVLVYHLRQSFKPGETDPETANKIGYELALKFTNGKHAFVVATHIDKGHIHNHIIFNSTNLDSTKKFSNPWLSSLVVRNISDFLCVTNGLSIIKDPKLSKGHYGTWLGDKKEPSDREKLEVIIDKILKMKPSSFEDFIKLLEAENCEFKRDRRSVRLPGKKGFLRLKSLTNDYTEEAIRERISGKRVVQPRVIVEKAAYQPKKFSLLIAMQDSIKSPKSPGYEQWIKIHNAKQAAHTLIYLENENIDDFETLDARAQQAKDNHNNIRNRTDEVNSRMKIISDLQKHIGAYSKTKDIYAEYKRKKFSKKFYAENESAIERCKAAKAFFNEHNLDKLPPYASLEKEYAALSAERKTLITGEKAAKKIMVEILTAQQNVNHLLSRKPETDRANDRSER